MFSRLRNLINTSYTYTKNFFKFEETENISFYDPILQSNRKLSIYTTNHSYTEMTENNALSDYDITQLKKYSHPLVIEEITNENGDITYQIIGVLTSSGVFNKSHNYVIGDKLNLTEEEISQLREKKLPIPQQHIVFSNKIEHLPADNTGLTFSFNAELTKKVAKIAPVLVNHLLNEERIRRLPKPPTKKERVQEAYNKGIFNKKQSLLKEYDKRVKEIINESKTKTDAEARIKDLKQSWEKFLGGTKTEQDKDFSLKLDKDNDKNTPH